MLHFFWCKREMFDNSYSLLVPQTGVNRCRCSCSWIWHRFFSSSLFFMCSFFTFLTNCSFSSLSWRHLCTTGRAMASSGSAGAAGGTGRDGPGTGRDGPGIGREQGRHSRATAAALRTGSAAFPCPEPPQPGNNSPVPSKLSLVLFAGSLGVWFSGCPAQGQVLDSMILLGRFHLSLLCDSVTFCD